MRRSVSCPRRFFFFFENVFGVVLRIEEELFSKTAAQGRLRTLRLFCSACVKDVKFLFERLRIKVELETHVLLRWSS